MARKNSKGREIYRGLHGPDRDFDAVSETRRDRNIDDDYDYDSRAAQELRLFPGIGRILTYGHREVIHAVRKQSELANLAPIPDPGITYLAHQQVMEQFQGKLERAKETHARKASRRWSPDFYEDDYMRGELSKLLRQIREDYIMGSLSLKIPVETWGVRSKGKSEEGASLFNLVALAGRDINSTYVDRLVHERSRVRNVLTGRSAGTMQFGAAMGTEVVIAVARFEALNYQVARTAVNAATSGLPAATLELGRIDTFDSWPEPPELTLS